MIYLNFTDLNEETQERLLANSKEDVKEKHGKDIMDYATKHNTNLTRCWTKKHCGIYIPIPMYSTYNFYS